MSSVGDRQTLVTPLGLHGGHIEDEVGAVDARSGPATRGYSAIVPRSVARPANLRRHTHIFEKPRADRDTAVTPEKTLLPVRDPNSILSYDDGARDTPDRVSETFRLNVRSNALAISINITRILGLIIGERGRGASGLSARREFRADAK